MSIDRNGFTMLELVVVIGVITILAGLIAPLAVNTINQNRLNSCWEELQVIKKAMVGDPNLVETGSRSQFGFVGDLGILPRDNLGDLGEGPNFSLDDLIEQNNLSGPVVSNDVSWGWRGPYITELMDPWGRDYMYTTHTGNALIAATVWSLGPDGTNGTSDDISISIRKDEVFSIISGNTLDGNGAGTDCTITIFYPNGAGVVDSVYTTTAAVPFYSTSNINIPIGIRRIVFNSGSEIPYIITINNGPITTVNFREP